MADNESTISMEAEVSVNSTKAVSGVDKLSKSIEGLTKGISNLSKELESALKNVEKIAASANQSVSNMSKVDINAVSRHLASTPQKAISSQGKSRRQKRSSRTAGVNPTGVTQTLEEQVDSIIDTGIDADTAKQFAALIRAHTQQQMLSYQDVLNSIEISKQENAKMRSMLKAQQAELDAYNSETRRMEAQNRSKSIASQDIVNQEKANALAGRAAQAQATAKEKEARATLALAQAARANDDYRFKPGLYGGIASGISGMNSRLRSRSGFAGFAARVGTGVGQKLGMNAFKGATMSGLGINMGTAVAGAAGVAVTKLVEAIGKLTVESIRAYGEVEKLKTSLSVVYGSDVEANTAFSGIKDYALESPFGIEQSTEMAILLKQSGVYGTELLDVMKMIGDTAGGNEEKFRRIANNYAQIASIGKASMLDMRQFAYAGIPIYKMVAEELKVSQSVLRQMISDGEVTNEVIEKVFKTMTSEGGTFYKAVERGAATLNARLVNLQDAMEMAKAAFGEWAFNVDIPGTGGNSLDGEGTLGRILTFIEDIAAKADSWASLINIQKDVAAISGREVATDELSVLISKMESAGKDTSGLRNIRSKLSGIDTDESILATYTSAYDQVDKRLTDLNNVISLELELENLKDVDLSGLETETQKYIKQYIKDLENQIKDAYSLTRPAKDNSFVYAGKKYNETQFDISKHIRDREGKILEYTPEYYELRGVRSDATPYKYQSVANTLVTSLFEQAQKTASASSSLGSWTVQTNLEYKNSEKGKAEAEEKHRLQYEENYKEFYRLKQYIDDSGNLIDSMNVDLGTFMDIMESGIIEPLEAVSLSFHDLAQNTSDTAKLTKEKQDTWLGMQERASDVSQLRYALPPEVRSAFDDIVIALNNSNKNTEENINFINTALNDLYKSDAYKNNAFAQNVLQYIFTKSASIAPDPKDYEDVYGKGSGEEFIPLWKRITGSATGIDPSKITTAKDFYEIYSKQFQSRNLSQGVISGMVASGKSARDITKNLRYTGEKASDGTLLIDWERTAEVMHDFAMSAGATVFELRAYQSALEEQIGVYDTLKETIFTTGEDWDKLDNATLEKQLENAFSGIDGAKMVAVNDYGEERLVEFNEQMELVFKGTNQLVSAQDEYKMSMERTIDAIDEASDALVLMKQNVDNATIEKTLGQEGVNQSILAQIQKLSADNYLKTGEGKPETMLNYISTYIESMIDKRGTEENVKLAETKKERETSAFKTLQLTGRADLTQEELTPDFLIEQYKSALELATLLKEQGADPFGDRYIDDDYNRYSDIVTSIKLLTDAIIAGAVENGDVSEIAKYGPLYYATRDEDSRLKFHKGEEDKILSDITMKYAQELKGARQYFSDRGTITGNVYEALRSKEGKLALNQVSRLSKIFREIADATGELNPSLEELREILLAQHHQAMELARSSGDLAGLGQARQEMGLDMYATGTTSSERTAGLGEYTAGGLQQVGADAIAGTDIGAFAEGAMQGGPLVGLINMFINALGNLVGSIEIMSYALNPISNLLQGFAPLLKMLMLPLVLVSHGFETLGDLITDFLEWIDREENLKALDDYYNSLLETTEQQEQLAERLQALNDILDKTRRAMIEAEQYYLKRNMEANAQWAAQMQGKFVMDTRGTKKVNDMILTPHGNFSTAPDDYLLAMKDPTSLMGTGGGSSVEISFIVNNTVSDMVETSTEERTNKNGQKELVVTISKLIASDYASGRNGWDSAISGRESRRTGRRIAR